MENIDFFPECSSLNSNNSINHTGSLNFGASGTSLPIRMALRYIFTISSSSVSWKKNLSTFRLNTI